MRRIAPLWLGLGALAVGLGLVVALWPGAGPAPEREAPTSAAPEAPATALTRRPVLAEPPPELPPAPPAAASEDVFVAVLDPGGRPVEGLAVELALERPWTPGGSEEDPRTGATDSSGLAALEAGGEPARSGLRAWVAPRGGLRTEQELELRRPLAPGSVVQLPWPGACSLLVRPWLALEGGPDERLVLEVTRRTDPGEPAGERRLLEFAGREARVHGLLAGEPYTLRLRRPATAERPRWVSEFVEFVPTEAAGELELPLQRDSRWLHYRGQLLGPDGEPFANRLVSVKVRGPDGVWRPHSTRTGPGGELLYAPAGWTGVGEVELLVLGAVPAVGAEPLESISIPVEELATDRAGSTQLGTLRFERAQAGFVLAGRVRTEDGRPAAIRSLRARAIEPPTTIVKHPPPGPRCVFDGATGAFELRAEHEPFELELTIALEDRLEPFEVVVDAFDDDLELTVDPLLELSGNLLLPAGVELAELRLVHSLSRQRDAHVEGARFRLGIERAGGHLSIYPRTTRAFLHGLELPETAAGGRIRLDRTLDLRDRLVLLETRVRRLGDTPRPEFLDARLVDGQTFRAPLGRGGELRLVLPAADEVELVGPEGAFVRVELDAIPPEISLELGR